ncbi:MAG: AAA family ATPase [Candidatus Promineifilaceae bacterium]
MIPVKLEITNFLSYRRTAVLDFGGIHLAGIGGPNGAGKSSIMEAMTWALFGQSRVRSDDDLVNRQAGEDGMAEVRFIFRLEEVRYRVIRSKQAGKTTSLELQMDAGDGGWKSLSESKIRETQAAIEGLLQMNYETFTNASFLLQGKADQFTTRTPSQRKEILAELLGVTQWEDLRERASTARKTTEGAVAMIEARLEEIANELAEEPARSAALEQAEANHLVLTERRLLKEKLLAETRLNESARQQLRDTINELESELKRLGEAHAKAEQSLQERLGRQEQLAAIIAGAEGIEADYAAWQAADAHLQTLREAAQAHNELLQKMQPLKVQLAQARSRLEQEQTALQVEKSRVEAAADEQATVSKALAGAEQELARRQEALTAAAEQQEALQSARAALQQTHGERRLWQQELQGLQAQAQQINALAVEKTAEQQAKEAAQAAIETLSEQIEIIDEQQQNYNQLQAELQSLTMQQPVLHEEMNRLKGRIDELESAAGGGDCPLCTQPLTEEHRFTVIDSLRADGTSRANLYRTNEARIKALKVELPQVEKTIQKGPPLVRDRQAQQKRLVQAETRLEEIAAAQSAWSTTGEKRLVELAASLADESSLNEQTAQVEALEATVRAAKEVQDTVQALQKDIAGYTARLHQLTQRQEEWKTEGAKRLAEVASLLAAESYVPEARLALAQLQEELDGIAFDAGELQAATSRRQELADAPERYQALREARAALEPLQQAVVDLQQQLKAQEQERMQREKRLAEMREQLNVLDSGAVDVRGLEAEVTEVREAEIAAAQKVGAARQKIQVLENQRALREELQAEKKALTLRVQRLTLLEKSCGRKGVQALLIEHALPEIEEGANDLLDRLTGGEMSIKFDTQRRLKSRDAMAETLDIVISDRAGERPYDNYSGGEQFRINFAIRLALSRLLAHRAGARLQTLVIDEGFGSQDPQGRQRLIEAINAIQDDFACILVITHIDELREAFPTRIEVSKEPVGSTISVQ